MGFGGSSVGVLGEIEIASDIDLLPYLNGDVYELISGFAYRFSSTIITPNRLSVVGLTTEPIVLCGIDDSFSRIIFTGTGDAFTSVGYDLRIKDLSIIASTGTVFNIDGGAKDVNISGCDFSGSDDAGVIFDGAFVNFTKNKLIGVNKGIIFDGSHTPENGKSLHLQVFTNEFINTVATSPPAPVDTPFQIGIKGTHAFVNISQDNIIHPFGIQNGVSGNPIITKKGKLIGNSGVLVDLTTGVLVNTPVSGPEFTSGSTMSITPEDIFWLFKSNSNIVDSEVFGVLTWEDNNLETPIGATNNFQPVQITGTLLSNSQRFEVITSQFFVGPTPFDYHRMKYKGLETVQVTAVVTADIERGRGGTGTNPDYTVGVYRDVGGLGITILLLSGKAFRETDGAKAEGVSYQATTEISTDDELYTVVKNATGTRAPLFANGQIRITQA